MSRLQGKTALVTGGSSGIGLAVAATFLGEGANVVIAGRDEARLKVAESKLGSVSSLASVRADVSEETDAKCLVDSVIARFGSIDIAVNNAGLNVKERAFRRLSTQDWRQMMRTNLDGAFYVTRAVFPKMAERRDGIIVFVSSIAGKSIFTLAGAGYSASKFGMSSLGLSLAAEEKDSGVRVSVIYPGEVDTPILDHRPEPLTPEQKEAILKPEDVAEAVLFVVTLPPRVSVPEMVLKPTGQRYI